MDGKDLLKPRYTGVGSRETPSHVLSSMKQIASHLEQMGYILRSGGAIGADKAFESGVENPRNKEIYFPGTDSVEKSPYWEESVKMALELHPNPSAARKYIRWLGRNPFQVLGDDLKHPSIFLVCWTRDGKDSGGTGTTIRVARKFNVPVYNLHSMNVTDILTIIQSRP